MIGPCLDEAAHKVGVHVPPAQLAVRVARPGVEAQGEIEIKV